MQKSFVLAVAVVVSAVGPCLITAQRHTRTTSQPYIPLALKAAGSPTGITEPVEAFHATVNIYGINLFMGTAICSNYETVRFVEDLYRKYVEDHRADELTKGESQLTRGAPASAPRVENFGCISVPDGTPMLLEKEHTVPVVDLKVGDVWVRGVTSQLMFEARAVTANPGNSGAPVNAGLQGASLNNGKGRITPPVLISSADPEFSEKASKEGFSGRVQVHCIVDEQGNAMDVHVVKAVGMGLDENAVAAVRQYKFKPATKDGLPVKFDLDITVDFQFN